MKNTTVMATDEMNFIDDLDKVISKLRQFGFIHSIILFGSRAKGTDRTISDVDLCIIPKPGSDISLTDIIALNNSVPKNIDISLFNELPVYIRKRVFLEGKVLYTEDLYNILTLAKENDLEYTRHERLERDYHKIVMKRVRARLG